jgi:hypothetical protein
VIRHLSQKLINRSFRKGCVVLSAPDMLDAVIGVVSYRYPFLRSRT